MSDCTDIEMLTTSLFSQWLLLNGDHELRPSTLQVISIYYKQSTEDQSTGNAIQADIISTWPLHWLSSTENKETVLALALSIINSLIKEVLGEQTGLFWKPVAAWKRNATVLLLWAREVKPAQTNHPFRPVLRAKFGIKSYKVSGACSAEHKESDGEGWQNRSTVRNMNSLSIQNFKKQKQQCSYGT